MLKVSLHYQLPHLRYLFCQQLYIIFHSYSKAAKMPHLDLFKDIFLLLNKKAVQFLLSDEENQFISFIYSTAETYIRETEQNEFKNECDFQEKVAETRSVMEDVLLRFQKTDEARSEFLDKFPPWAEYRKTTVE
ncbi:hypothetical protein TNCV_1606711 [Trichonephila clavipes]|nr:hypothetical protein TNCV_1606711 [Trichonephila clavipes]